MILSFAPLIYGFQLIHEDVRSLAAHHVEHTSDGHPVRVEHKTVVNKEAIAQLRESIHQLEKVVHTYQKETIAVDSKQTTQIERLNHELYNSKH